MGKRGFEYLMVSVLIIGLVFFGGSFIVGKIGDSLNASAQMIEDPKSFARERE